MSETTSLLPPNATQIERAFEAAIGEIGAIPTPVRDAWNADTCPMPLLPWLAWGLGVRTWDSAWSDTIKRSVVRQALAIARRRGTAESVQAVVQSLGGDIVMREWFEQDPPAPAHTFTVVLNLNGDDGEPAGASFVENAIVEIRRTKPARSHFTFTQGLSTAGDLALFGGAQVVVYRRLEFEEAA